MSWQFCYGQHFSALRVNCAHVFFLLSIHFFFILPVPAVCILLLRSFLPGVLMGILGGGVPPGSPYFRPKMSFSSLVFRPDL